MKRITVLLSAVIALSVLFAFTVSAAVIVGDVDGNGAKNADDAIYLLYNYYFPDDYPVNQKCDFNNDGSVDANDAIYLLYNYYFGDSDYPLASGGIDTGGKDKEGSEFGPFHPFN